MVLNTGHFIQILQLIVLAITAEIFVAQFALRLFQDSEVTKKLESAKGKEAVDALRNGVQTIFVSMFFFATSGTLMAVYLILHSVPNEVTFFMSYFESNLRLFGALTLLIVLAIALVIGGDSENPNKGIIGAVIGSFLTAVFSFFVIMVYAGLWAATRSADWVFFLSMIAVALAMGFFLFGTLIMANNLLDILDELYEGIRPE